MDFKSFGCGLAVGVMLAAIFAALWLHGAYRRLTAYEAAARARAIGSADAGVSVGDGAIAALLQPIRQQYALPAMAAAIVTGEGVLRVGAVGVLKRGAAAPVALDSL